MKTQQVDYRYPNDGTNNYVLTIEGREIGRVYELEHAELIAHTFDRKEIEHLTEDTRDLKDNLERFQALNEDLQEQNTKLKNKLDKIQILSEYDA